MSDRARRASAAARGTLHVAVVHGPGEIRFVAAGFSREAMLERLAANLLEEVGLQLWEEEADRFRALVEEGRTSEAVEYYFSRVGERWDPQRVSIHSVHC
jgi:hypothetical protein